MSKILEAGEETPLRCSHQHSGGESVLELGTCVLASTRFCDFLVLVLVLLQTTHVLWVYNVYNSWVVLSENHATNNREYSRVHRFPALAYCHQMLIILIHTFYMSQTPQTVSV